MEIKKERGTVISVSDERAKIKLVRSMACEGCPGSGLCGILSKRYRMLEAENPVGATPGQEVIVSLQAENELKASFIIYVIPTISLFIGAILGYYLKLWGSSDSSAAFLSIVFLILAFLGIRQYSKKFTFRPVITEVLNTE
ncbi:Positive regulator of sigma(E), RseC/MucC [Candidatus Desulfofervidus auxilii]|uniref:Positive regulator of sigma(E), RseC/MucC n=1 Tax=Desulfofervidus auxilii TaxID=1621989 RepID=A0A7C1VYB1_DESA2|nr:SoxR reducing system RseC family protein [Candidatus Desulfofervidus auxilii]AMM41413.1 Positive regulator of sigma(E), RseC/MucC [Candidatus Desulfofervidus auxilii]CAD7778130.1 Positive regulator of sigma(E), RseC/MucC [Candidatus Methanoperedenaceae archaeon GB50]HEC68539.1 hypothetical protein [Candidatus Desulfofervidus auxilii]